MSRKSGLRKQKKKLAMQWVDEQFDVPIQFSSKVTRLFPRTRGLIILERPADTELIARVAGR